MEQKMILRESQAITSVLFKLPEEKDPVIAICFASKEEAEQTNADLIERNSKDRYALNIWVTKPSEKRLNIMLLSEYNERMYKNLSYNSNQFSWWLKFTEGNRYQLQFQLCHIYMNSGKMQLAKTAQTNKPFMLNINRFNLKNKEYLIA